MRYIFKRIKEIVFSKRGKIVLVSIAVFLFLGSIFNQEKNRISFVEPKSALYKIEKDDFNAIEYAEETLENIADFVVETPEVEPAPIISSTETVLDSYYAFAGAPTAEDSFNELLPLQGELPILIRDIPTSSGLEVGARISNPYYSDQTVLVIEITGPNYYKLSPQSLENPNIVAFRDAFLAVKQELAKYGVDLAKTRFNLGDRGQQLGASVEWLNFLKLIP